MRVHRMAFWTSVEEISVPGVSSFMTTPVARLHAINLTSQHFNDAQIDLLLKYLGDDNTVATHQRVAPIDDENELSAMMAENKEEKASTKPVDAASQDLLVWRGDRLMENARRWGLVSNPKDGNGRRILMHASDGVTTVAHLLS